MFRVGTLLNNCLLCMLKHSQTSADLIPYAFINNGDDSISMTRGASSLEDYFWNLLILQQLAVFQTPQQSSLHVRQAAFYRVWTVSSSGRREKNDRRMTKKYKCRTERERKSPRCIHPVSPQKCYLDSLSINKKSLPKVQSNRHNKCLKYTIMCGYHLSSWI